MSLLIEHRLCLLLFFVVGPRQRELHAARNNTVILKFMLHMSKDVQGKRLLARVNTPVKHWKFSAADLNERQHWDNYQRAYQDVLEATSRPWAPWYVVPADNKPYCQMVVAGIIEEAVAMLKLKWPKASGSNVARIQDARKILEQELASTKDIDDLKGSHEKEWGTLADSEKTAAQNLGYDQETWSKKKRVEHREHSAVFAEMVEKKIRETKWYSMPFFKQSAALEIGFVAETWNNPDVSPPPPPPPSRCTTFCLVVSRQRRHWRCSPLTSATRLPLFRACDHIQVRSPAAGKKMDRAH